MRVVCKPLLALVAIGVFAIAAVQGADDAAQEQKKSRKKGRDRDVIAKMVENIDLTADQQVKLEEVKREFHPKLADLAKRRGSIMTDDRRAKEKDLRKAAKDAGKTGKEIRSEIAAALSLSPAERDQMAAIERDERQLRGEITSRIRAFLNDEQKAKLPERRKDRKKKGNQ
jgi:Spy/CpxP family protein refolding chaperone